MFYLPYVIVFLLHTIDDEWQDHGKEGDGDLQGGWKSRVFRLEVCVWQRMIIYVAIFDVRNRKGKPWYLCNMSK